MDCVNAEELLGRDTQELRLAVRGAAVAEREKSPVDAGGRRRERGETLIMGG